MSKPDDDDVLRRAAHDLKNPLAVVRASVEWLEGALDTIAGAGGTEMDDARDALRDAASAVVQMTRVVDDLSALARLAGDPTSVAVALAPLAVEAVEACAER